MFCFALQGESLLRNSWSLRSGAFLSMTLVPTMQARVDSGSGLSPPIRPPAGPDTLPPPGSAKAARCRGAYWDPGARAVLSALA